MTSTPPINADAPPTSVFGTSMTGSVVVVTGATVVVVGCTDVVTEPATCPPCPAEAAIDVVGEEEDHATVVDVAPDDGADTGTVVVPAAAAATVVVVLGTVVVAAPATVVVVVDGTVVVTATVVVDAGAAVVVVATAVLIVTEPAEVNVGGPVLDAASRTEFAPSRAMTVPSEPHTTETVTEFDAVEAAGAAVHPVAVPPKEKSPDAIPDTASLKVSVYDIVREELGEDGAVHATVGGVISEPGTGSAWRYGYPSLIDGLMFHTVEKSHAEKVDCVVSWAVVLPTPPAPQRVVARPEVVVFQ